MVDYNQLIEVNISKSSKYYKNKGYDIEKYKVRYVSPYTGVKEFRYTIPSGTTMLVPLYDLQANSAYLIKVICDYCGKEILVPYNIYRTRTEKSITKKDACKQCLYKKKSEGIVFDKLSDAKLLFEKKNCTLLNEQEFVKSNDILYYICNNHPDKVQHVRYHNIKRGQGMCQLCGYKSLADQKRTPYEKVKQAFDKRNYKLLTQEEDFKDCDQRLEYICPKHADVIQKISYYHLSKRKQGCSLCAIENKCGENHHNWKGGISPLHNYLRETAILPWKKDTLAYYGYKCVLTNNQSFLVHHLCGFDKILNELIDYFKKNHNLNLRGIKVEDLSEEQLKMVSDKCLEMHYERGLGVVLDVDVHKLFHKQYKYGQNTPQQFEEFRQRYLAGEFSDAM
jgi:hypothetical protein